MARTRLIAAVLAMPGGLVLVTALGDGGLRLLRGSGDAGADPAAAVAGLAAVVASLISAWLTLCLGLSLGAELPGAVGHAARRLRDRVTPVVVRRWAAIVLGASVSATVMPGTAVAVVRSVDAAPSPTPGWHPTAADTAGPAPDAGATPTPGFAPPSRASTSTHEPAAPGRTQASRLAPPSPGWLPTRPTTRYRDDPRLLTGSPRTTTADPSVVVRRGDTLWSIAAAHLGPDATDAEITRAWPRWHETNAATIGPDPHALRAGTVLSPPPTP